MGVTAWRPPLPRTATAEEMEADLRELRREVRRARVFVLVVDLVGVAVAFALTAAFILGLI